MKKLISSVLFAALLVVSAGQAQAALLTDWTYNLTEVKLTNFNSEFVDVATGSNGKETGSFQTGPYGVTLAPNGSADGPLYFEGANSSASSDQNDNLLNQTTSNNPVQNTPATKVADLTFSYSVASVANPNVFMTITYTMPLYTYYDSSTQTAYIYYNNSDVSTRGATAITHDGYKYGITGVGLFVDGRAIENFEGAEGDPNLYSGWAINEDTMNNYYDDYVVGGENVSLGSKGDPTEGLGLGIGDFSITGVFSIANTAVTPPPSATPEPATMLLTGLGLAGMGFMKRRGKKA